MSVTMLVNVEKHKGSLKKASYDSANKESLIGDEEQEVYILDDIAKEIAGKLEIETPSSCDSVVINNEKIYMIEFKNRHYKSVTSNDKREIRKKAYQSREILLSTLLREQNINYIAEHVQLFVVFKSMEGESESFDKIAGAFNRFANGNEPEIKCKLSYFEGSFYKKVRTMSKEEFEKIYMKQIFA